MDLEEMGWEIVDWIHLDQDTKRRRAVVTKVMNIWFLQNAGNCLTMIYDMIF
jgi:hypothetical protein